MLLEQQRNGDRYPFCSHLSPATFQPILANMPGLYLHIPFCKQACHYCNFHFSTSLKLKAPLLEALQAEIGRRANELTERSLQSIYFGGGTPSLLSADEINLLFGTIERYFSIQSDAEITIEANPDDLTAEKLTALRHTAVNRLSIGIQSFWDTDLKFMNRSHNATEARTCIDRAKAIGFDQLTIDLIYGSPTTSDAQWAENLRIALGYQLPHLSSYCLTVEPRTALGHFVAGGKIADVDDEHAARQFEMLMAATAAAGYEHYEISNFALPLHYARHNTSYWQGDPYLGVGPSAHSFDGKTRRWNIANNARYIKYIREGAWDQLTEIEVLTPRDCYHEYIMTGLRTKWGVNIERIADPFREHFLKSIQPYLEQGLVIRSGKQYALPPKGRLLADRIAGDLFI